ncbi:hypothetical protein KGF56_001579 [Candida oxycetoniae]|uniref:Major facilitator superfamily (MFS) profile domain-containing protein n=1 Tax=Candida oxycetoniae TaxID=497107 RepID=A0AAI9WYP0_9ASCO|nr:uncharacterized protein KGF56_001579 [Candida oxycetoniae]KAI3405561.2 hypothetical protein KGF56_001579 [Candida oxycetoniae]
MSGEGATEDTNQTRFPHLAPNIIHDPSAETSGLIAGELAAEDGSMISRDNLISHTYGSVSHGELPKNYAIDDPHGGYALPKAQLYTVVSSLFMASYLAALDATVVTTLLSFIASELHAVQNISWIATAYLLSSAAFQPIFGKISDIFGRKLLLIGCCFLFGLGCLICVTDSLVWLVIGRFVTGIGGSGLTSIGTMAMSDLIPLRDRGLYQGLANIFFGLGSASGGIIGGIIADTLGWKYVFALQVPLAVIVGVAIQFNLNLPQGSPGLGAHGQDIWQKLKRVDFLGSIFLISSLMMFLTAASLGGKEISYTSNSFLLMTGGSGLFFAAFVFTEIYISEEPIIPIELLGNRTVLASSLTNWFYTMGVFTTLFYVPVFYTSVKNLTASQNGWRLVPNFLGVSFGSVGAGYYMKKTGRYYKLAIGAGILSVAGVFKITLLNTSTPTWQQYLLLIPSGLGYSCMLTVTLLALIAATPKKFQACTTSIQYTFRSTGSTLGVSIASAIFMNVLSQQLTKNVSAIISDPKLAKRVISRALDSTSYVNEAPKYVRGAIRDSYEAGCKGTFYFALLTIFLGFVSSLFMREHRLHTSINRD